LLNKIITDTSDINVLLRNEFQYDGDDFSCYLDELVYNYYVNSVILK